MSFSRRNASCPPTRTPKYSPALPRKRSEFKLTSFPSIDIPAAFQIYQLAVWTSLKHLLICGDSLNFINVHLVQQRTPTCQTHVCLRLRVQGWFQDFTIEGAQRCAAHNPSAKHRVPLIRPGTIGPEVKGTGSSKPKVLDALSCYLRLIFKHSDTTLNKRKHGRSNLEGARASGSATV